MSESLEDIAAKMMAPGKGILAADESTSTIKKRFDSIDVHSDEASRAAYRELLFGALELPDYLGCFTSTETIVAAGGRAAVVVGTPDRWDVLLFRVSKVPATPPAGTLSVLPIGALAAVKLLERPEPVAAQALQRRCRLLLKHIREDHRRQACVLSPDLARFRRRSDGNGPDTHPRLSRPRRDRHLAASRRQ